MLLRNVLLVVVTVTVLCSREVLLFIIAITEFLLRKEKKYIEDYIKNMSSNSFILWPRHEVLQLINPAIPQPGKSLSHGLAIEAVRQLAKMQSPDGSIR